MSQRVALGALQGGGRNWCRERIARLSVNRAKMKAVVRRTLGPTALAGNADSAIYMMYVCIHACLVLFGCRKTRGVGL